MTKARVAYEDLLALWKDADPDLSCRNTRKRNSQHSDNDASASRVPALNAMRESDLIATCAAFRSHR